MALRWIRTPARCRTDTAGVRSTDCRLLSTQKPLRDLNCTEENTQRAEIQHKALQISRSWPAADSLVLPIPRYKSRDATPSNNITHMTTNFMIYLPQRTMYQQPTNKPHILRHLQLLLLKRSPQANPFPNAWTAISGRLEHSLDGALESPIEAALREIKEETNQDPTCFRLETALPPFAITSPGSKTWRVWLILWRIQLHSRQHDFPLDGAENVSDPEARRKTSSSLSELIRLDHENVEFSWESWEGLNALPELVPGLVGSFERLVDQWVEANLRTD